MKYIIILGDGMADYPIEKLGGKTPLMFANTPNIDALCAKGRTGKLITVPEDMPPGSEVANLAVLGYDVKKVFQGRGVLEAASMGVKLADDDLALRCNLICIEDEKIKNHSAGHITTEESHQLISYLQEKLGDEIIHFYPGVSYRHLLVVKGGNKEIHCTPPHDVPGTLFLDVLIKPLTDQGISTAGLLNRLILRSRELLNEHPVNMKRKAAGKDMANSIWPWSPGYKPEMKTFKELYGLTGAVISAVDLLHGIGAYAGFRSVSVDGTTGLYDTNYEGKAKAALEALKEVDFVYLHIEASDEAGHEGDVDLKVKTIEYLDERVVRYIVDETSKWKEPVTIAILPDHPTPCILRTHIHDAVPFIIYKPGTGPDEVKVYDEESVKEGYYGTLKGDEFIKELTGFSTR